ncbi:hypothetical protein M3Y95_01284900 [Aphelenchoides besseyi]|nr:hypothetical protein M3Y95_01284900 [Aphelenchoides besseyi]
MRLFLLAIFVFVVDAKLRPEKEITKRDPCIQEANNQTGFEFVECTDAELSIKWWSNHSLRAIQIVPQKFYKDLRTFTLIIDDKCVVNFRGQMREEMKYAEWVAEDGTVLTDCGDPTNCDLQIDTNGVLRRASRFAEKVPLCLSLRNPINDLWVWTKIRVVNFPWDWRLTVDVFSPDVSKISEYHAEV